MSILSSFVAGRNVTLAVILLGSEKYLFHLGNSRKQHSVDGSATFWQKIVFGGFQWKVSFFWNLFNWDKKEDELNEQRLK